MTEVVITGIGMHGGLGDVAETFDALAKGRTAVAPYRLAGVPGFPDILAAPAQPYDAGRYLPDRKLVKYMSPTAQLAVLASGRAIESAGLLHDDSRRATLALFVSTGHIAFDLSTVVESAEACKTAEGGFDLKRMGSDGLRLCHPLMPFKMLLNMPLGLVSIVFGIRGENFIVYPGADQAAIAIETAWRGIRNGRFDRALAGGSAQGLSPVPLATLIRQDRVARPGETNQHRWAIADLAAFVVLESAEAAGDRGANPIAQIDSPHLARPAERSQEAIAAVFGTGADTPRPDVIVSTGCLDPADQQAHKAAAAHLWPGMPPARVSFDDRLGYGGAASLPTAIGLSAEMTCRSSVPGQPDLGAPRELLIFSAAPDESLFSCRVRAMEKPR